MFLIALYSAWTEITTRWISSNFLFITFSDQERAAKFDEKGRPPLKRGLSAKSHSLFEAEDKAAEEMILTARKHLFMANNLYSVSNHLREIIEKGEDSATAKVTKMCSISVCCEAKLFSYDLIIH